MALSKDDVLNAIAEMSVMDIVELIMAFEEEFSVEIPDDVAEKIKTVKDTVEFIDSAK